MTTHGGPPADHTVGIEITQPTVPQEEHMSLLRDEERQPCEVWTRVMGYLRPTSEWNAAKQAEHRDRLPYRPPGQRHLEV